MRGASPIRAAVASLTIALSAANQEDAAVTETAHDGLKLRVYEPVVIAESEPGESRWGYYQFPTISRLPDARLLVTFNDGPDRDDFYGTPGPAYVSSDDGVTWTRYTAPDALLTISHSVVSEVANGEFLCVPMAPAMDIEKEGVKLPELSGEMDVYGPVLLYKLSDCEPRVQEYMRSLPAVRWHPHDGQWKRETVVWDTRDALVRTRKSDYVLPKPYIDNRVVRVNDRLYYPDFHLNYLLSDMSHPKNYACRLMVSDDNGRTWRRRSVIAYDETGDTMMGEPSLVRTAAGDFVCVIRSTDHRQRPMLITRSSDDGMTWGAPKPLHPFGVMPQTLRLDNGMLVLSFGRPGVHLMLSPDGSGRHWTGAYPIIASDDTDYSDRSCGYTGLAKLSDRSFLLVYSDLKYAQDRSPARRAILARRIAVVPSG